MIEIERWVASDGTVALVEHDLEKDTCVGATVNGIKLTAEQFMQFMKESLIAKLRLLGQSVDDLPPDIQRTMKEKYGDMS